MNKTEIHVFGSFRVQWASGLYSRKIKKNSAAAQAPQILRKDGSFNCPRSYILILLMMMEVMPPFDSNT